MSVCIKGGSGKLTEKKSEFISDVFVVHTQAEALNEIEKTKKKYYDASTHAYAFVAEGVEKYSDDGEPSGTAGKPVLDMLIKEGLTNICVVVTRYFGGIHLGTGGLVRAFTETAKLGIKEASFTEEYRGNLISLEIEYNLYGKLNNLVTADDFFIIDSKFSDKVQCKILVLSTSLNYYIKSITELSCGKIKLLDNTESKFIILEGKIILEGNY